MGEETDVGRQRLNHSSISLSRFSELNKALDTNEYNWTTNSVRLILGSQYSLCKYYIKRAHLLWGLKQVFSTNLIPLRTKLVTQTKGAPAWPSCYQSTLISGTSFFGQLYFPSSGRRTNEIIWKIVASSPFLCPLRLCRSLARSRETHFTRPNRRACLQANFLGVGSRKGVEWGWALIWVWLGLRRRGWALINFFCL